jgi:hypothetical protein
LITIGDVGSQLKSFASSEDAFRQTNPFVDVLGLISNGQKTGTG